MLKRLATTAALTLLLVSCAGGPPPEPPAPPPLDPVGTYDITVALEGMEILGVMVIRGSAAAGYTGSVDTDAGGAALAGIVVDGQTLSFTVPEAGVSARVTFEGEGFSGGMEGAMGNAIVFGKRRAGR